MGVQLAWFFDVAIIGIIVAYIYLGGKRGFLRSLVLILGYVVSLVGAYLISDISSPVIYEKFIEPKVEQQVTEKMSSFDIKEQIRIAMKKEGINIELSDSEIDVIINNSNEFSDSFSSFVGEASDEYSESELKEKLDKILNFNSIVQKLKEILPESFSEKIDEYFKGDEGSVTLLIKALNNPDTDERSSEVVDLLFKPFALSMTKFIVFMLAFAVLQTIFRALSNIFKKIYLIPVAGQLNSLLGAILGLVQGLFIIFVVTLVIKIIISLFGNDLIVINEPTIDATRIYKYFYNLKFFK